MSESEKLRPIKSYGKSQESTTEIVITNSVGTLSGP